jgi:hypothetical protein
LDVSRSTEGVTEIFNDADLTIGRTVCTGLNGSEYFSGLLDEFGIYLRALSAREVEAIHLAGNAGKCAADVGGACPTLPTGCVGWWPGEGSVIDITGQGKSGYLVNGTAFAPGKVGQGFSFDGVDDLVRLGISPLLPPWTAECWVNRQDSSNDSAILLGDATTALKLEQWPNTRQVGFTRFGVADYTFDYIAPVGTWVHLAFVGNVDNTLLYVDGALHGTVATSVPLPLDQVGGDIDGRFANQLNGMLDELAVYNRALSASEIQAIYSAGSAGKCVVPPKITRIILDSGSATIYWHAQLGRTYRVQYRASLNPSGLWNDLAGDVTAAGDTTAKTDSTLGGASQRFYRVVLLP